MTEEELTERKNELFAPLYQQIMMTDNKVDMLLLATNMFTTSVRIFCDEYGYWDARKMMVNIINEAKNLYKN